MTDLGWSKEANKKQAHHSIIETLAQVLHITYLMAHPDADCNSYFWEKDNSSNNNIQNHVQIRNSHWGYERLCKQ